MEALLSSEGLLFALMQQEPETDANHPTLELCERRPHLALDVHAFGAVPNKTTDAIEIVAAAKARAEEKARADEEMYAINIKAAQAKAIAAQADARADEAEARADEEMYAAEARAAEDKARAAEEMYAINIKAAEAEARADEEMYAAKARAAEEMYAINIKAAQAKARAAQAEARAAEDKARAAEEMYAINIKAAEAEARADEEMYAAEARAAEEMYAINIKAAQAKAAVEARAAEDKARADKAIYAINIKAAQAKARAAEEMYAAEARAAEEMYAINIKAAQAKARADEEMYAINIEAAQAEARAAEENLRKMRAEADRASLLLEQDTRNDKASSSSRISPVCLVPTPPVTASPSSSPSGYSPSPRPLRVSPMVITPFFPNSSREEYVRRVTELCEPVWTVSRSGDGSLVFRLADASASQTDQEMIYLPEACQVRNLWRTLLENKNRNSDTLKAFSSVLCQRDKIATLCEDVSP